jgi:hypothetical protein
MLACVASWLALLARSDAAKEVAAGPPREERMLEIATLVHGNGAPFNSTRPVNRP